MRRVTQAMRARVELQGFEGLSDAEIHDIYYWLRVGPLVSGIWIAAGLMFGSAATLWALVPFLASGAILPRQPFDLFYCRVVCPQLGRSPIPASRAPHRFTCALMSLWLAAAGACFAFGAVTSGRAIGIALLVVTALHVATGYCLPAALAGPLRRRVTPTVVR